MVNTDITDKDTLKCIDDLCFKAPEVRLTALIKYLNSDCSNICKIWVFDEIFAMRNDDFYISNFPNYITYIDNNYAMFKNEQTRLQNLL